MSDADVLSRFFGLSPDLMGIARGDGYFTRVNRAFTTVLGWAPEELTARPWIEFVHPDDVEATLSAGSMLVDGLPVTAFRNRYRCKDGSYRWLDWQAVPSGVGNEIFAVARDVTELQELEQELAAANARLAARAETSELQFRELIDNLPELAWTARPDGFIDFYNRRWYEYTGTTYEVMQGWGWRDVHDPEMLPKVTERWQHSLATGEPFEMEFPLRGADGVFRWFLTRVVPLRDQHGEIVRWFGSNANIDELRRALARLRLALSAARAGAFEIDLATGQSRMSPELADLYGLPHDSGKSGLDVVIPEDLAQVAEDRAHALASDMFELRDFRIRRPVDGEVRWMHAYTSLVHEGTNTRFLGIVLDITERKAVDERYRVTFEQAAGGLAEIAIDGHWLKVNERLCQISGYARDELLQLRIQDVTYPDDLDTDLDLMRQLIEGKRKTYTLEKRYVRKDGRVVWILLTVALVRKLDGTPDYFIKVVEDIDELHALRESLEARVEQRTAELAAANRELETFSYSVSHDLRAPLRAISGFARALREHVGETLDDGGTHYLTRIEASAIRMGQLIDELLGLSRVARAPVVRRQVDVSALAETVRGTLEDRVRWTIQPGITASADPGLLRIALENLLGNAVKFSRETASAHVEVGVQAHGNERVFFVRDNGAGFDMAHAKNLFGPFQRLHATSRFEGSGIGLATVQRIIARHGGRIWAESQPEQGATFYFTLGSEDDYDASISTARRRQPG